MATYADAPSALAQSNGRTLHLSITSELPFVETLSTYPLIHPAYPLQHSRNISTSTDSSSPIATTATLVDEPRFVPAYLAEPRETSSLVFDSFIDSMSSQSVYTLSSAASLAGDNDFNLPEMLADDMDLTLVDSQCNCAEAVRIVFAGPPKIVDLMRADRPRSKRASQIQFRRITERPTVSSIQPAVRASSVGSQESRSSEGSADRKTVASSTPSTPMLDNDETPGSPASETSPIQPATPRMSIDTSDRDFTVTKDSAHIAIVTPSPPAKSFMRKPSRLFLPKRTTSSTIQAIETSKVLPVTPPQTPSSAGRPASMFATTRPKLVARGASERSPIIELPPSPTLSERPSFPRSITALPALPVPAPPMKSTGRKSLSRGLRRMESRMGLNIY